MTVFELSNASVVRGEHAVLRDLNWTFREGDSWAIVGPIGSGKTTLAETLLGRHRLETGSLHWPLFDRLRTTGRKIDFPSQVVTHVTFREDSRLFSYAGRYYQQRFEFADSDTPLSLDQYLRINNSASDAELASMCERFGISELREQPFITLSNGQTRRARLARALLTKPELLILDDPFIGLDAVARTDLTALLYELVNDGKRLVLICREEMVPKWITHVLKRGERNAERGMKAEAGQMVGSGSSVPRSAFRVPRSEGEVLDLRDVTVTHAGHTILDRVSWSVRGGERWAVLGPNGSGKSTLLSLLCGDHPQAYSNHVELFGRRRGSGETIWDVKRNVGLLSPEFHLYFTEPLMAQRAAATGFFDALADRATSPEQNHRVKELFAAFGIAHLADRAFKSLSSGEQRLVLLVRALVKRPPLVILDEPFQSLDAKAIERCRAWLDSELGEDQTLLFVTHELSELPRTVTRTLRLDKGRIV
ncbi:MAG: ATP-binding cassette domain-containing protein [Planctomycetia bacterium]|nr:ATP-binding cassette domain-containing protein [Planctomycetia bacterium]